MTTTGDRIPNVGMKKFQAILSRGFATFGFENIPGECFAIFLFARRTKTDGPEETRGRMKDFFDLLCLHRPEFGSEKDRRQFCLVDLMVPAQEDHRRLHSPAIDAMYATHLMSDAGDILKNAATSAIAPQPGVCTSSGAPPPVGFISKTESSRDVAFSRFAA